MEVASNSSNIKPFVQMSGIHLNLPWFGNCVNELKAFGFQNEEQAILLMARQLKGNARQVYDSYVDSNEGGICQLAHFKELMGPKFIDDNFDIKIRYKLLNLKHNGSIAKYIEDEKNIFGNYSGMEDKDRIFYLMNNMKPAYLKILNKANPKTYIETINILIQKGNQLNMNAAFTGQKRSDEDMDIDIDVIERINNLQARMCWNCGSKDHLRRDYSPGIRVLSIPGEELKYSSTQEQAGVGEIEGAPTPIKDRNTSTAPQCSNDIGEKQDNKSSLETLTNPHKYFTASEQEEEIEKVDRQQKRPASFPDELIKRKTKIIRLENVNVAEIIDLGSLDPNGLKTPVWRINHNGTELKILLDSGARKCFISAKAAKILNATIEKVHESIYATVANGDGIELKKIAEVEIKQKNTSTRFKAYIFPLKHVDLILGIDWWAEYKLTPDYNEDCWKFTVNDKTYTIEKGFDNTTNYISANALNRIIKKSRHKELYMVSVKELEPVSENAIEKIKYGDNTFKNIIREYHNIF
ncbi:hypothetical protein BB561_006465 [Smittium simulii]|uniref:Ty3 transposon capsid-like protein domain-containing protein n=1 Tax=Smittium simulii TaxID=133385 RepID=A0A2T9Y428_9FUNG|nr:hypothetical protein BB561_006465 [Smittium simulii]